MAVRAGNTNGVRASRSWDGCARRKWSSAGPTRLDRGRGPRSRRGADGAGRDARIRHPRARRPDRIPAPLTARRRSAGPALRVRRLAGLHRPTAGWAKAFGRVMGPNSADLRRRIGYIPTNPQFPKGMTPITYLDYIARLFGLTANVRKPTSCGAWVTSSSMLHFRTQKCSRCRSRLARSSASFSQAHWRRQLVHLA